jgi:alanyl-tRNA synthetase
VRAAPVVNKNDPTLMFTNAGMNQFKDYFLGNAVPPTPRIADTQPCLRVSGKHNDLEDVGYDTYHHTLFEMLGNWSFGDYFKHEAIAWAWELLTEVYKIPKDRLYVTVFEGDEKEGIPSSKIALECWQKLVPSDHIVYGNKKDNFWEMGDTGPCGPCTEIHIDSRTDAERAHTHGSTLVNKDHPQVIEIWNNVFIQYNRLKNGKLEPLAQTHVDTGMGFERLVRVLQNKQSNYDTDVFSPIIDKIAQLSGHTYSYGIDSQAKTDVAMRVIADHIRAVSFIIADGQLPSANGAGYVCRRILRRAVRYGYTFLGFKQPFMHQIVEVLAQQFEGVFDNITSQKDFIAKIIYQEEETFLRTLANGLKRLDIIFEELKQQNKTEISGKIAFELYDTFGFPIDLTHLIAKENNFLIDEVGFTAEMQAQKTRAKAASSIDAQDWIEVQKNVDKIDFIGYDLHEVQTEIIKYRKVTSKGKELVQLVVSPTPFYAESGGQVGDTGVIFNDNETIQVLDTQKENNLIVHLIDKLPQHPEASFTAKINPQNRKNTQKNHTATHLLQAALRHTLGKHVEQRGSMVNPHVLRFDFSHFGKMTHEEIHTVETTVNQYIAQNITVKIETDLPINEAKQRGAMALFGEKYGDKVRVVTIDPDFSVELCGGTHTNTTGEIAYFKITSESSIQAGVRRIEALTSTAATHYINEKLTLLDQLQHTLGNPTDPHSTLQKTIAENHRLRKELDAIETEKLTIIAENLSKIPQKINHKNLIAQTVNVPNPDALKKLATDIKHRIGNENACIILGAAIGNKAYIAIAITDDLVANGLNANQLIKQTCTHIQGGGGGQAFLATAGGTHIQGLAQVYEAVKSLI